MFSSISTNSQSNSFLYQVLFPTSLNSNRSLWDRTRRKCLRRCHSFNRRMTYLIRCTSILRSTLKLIPIRTSLGPRCPIRLRQWAMGRRQTSLIIESAKNNSMWENHCKVDQVTNHHLGKYLSSPIAGSRMKFNLWKTIKAFQCSTIQTIVFKRKTGIHRINTTSLAPKNKFKINWGINRSSRTDYIRSEPSKTARNLWGRIHILVGKISNKMKKVEQSKEIRKAMNRAMGMAQPIGTFIPRRAKWKHSILPTCKNLKSWKDRARETSSHPAIAT